MDFPISVPSIGLVGGKFVDENVGTGTPGSLIPAQWGNAVTEEILKVITDAGIVPNEAVNTQLSAAIRAMSKGRLIGAPKTFFTAGPATYTPSPGMTLALVFASSGAGAGGGTVPTAAGQVAAGSGGASGSFWNGTLTPAQVGTSLPLTIGAGGSAVSGGGGNNGGSTAIGTLVTIPGGLGGGVGAALTNASAAVNGGGLPGAQPTVGAANTITQSGGSSGGYGIITPTGVLSGYGAGSPMCGGAGGGRAFGTGNPGASGTAPGSGGSGACAGPNSPALIGGSGLAGMVIIYEFGNPL